MRTMKKDEEQPGGVKDGGDSTANQVNGGGKEETLEGKNEAMKELLEEANKMLRMLRKEKGAEEERRRSAKDGRLDRLQQQLDALKTLKVFKVAKIQHGSGDGLLDPGADTSNYSDFGMWEGNQSPDDRRGTMIHSSPETEPIVPLGSGKGFWCIIQPKGGYQPKIEEVAPTFQRH